MPNKAKTSIRPEETHDFAEIHEVNRLAFGREAEAILVEKIRQLSDFIPELSLVAVHDGRVIGHILFSQVKIKPQNESHPVSPALSLAPMAVHPDFQNQGIGSMLVHRGLEECRHLGHSVVIVIGHPDYYPRFGFSSARAKGLEAPFPVPDEAFLVIELIPEALKAIKGTIIYPSVFDEVT